MTIKLCVECDFCKEDYVPYSKVFNCTEGVVMGKYEHNRAIRMVHGDITRYVDVRCTIARLNEDLCGKDAQRFRGKR